MLGRCDRTGLTDEIQHGASRAGDCAYFCFPSFIPSPPPLSFPTPGKTVPRHPLRDGHQVTVPPPPPGGP